MPQRVSQEHRIYMLKARAPRDTIDGDLIQKSLMLAKLQKKIKLLAPDRGSQQRGGMSIVCTPHNAVYHHVNYTPSVPPHRAPPSKAIGRTTPTVPPATPYVPVVPRQEHLGDGRTRQRCHQQREAQPLRRRHHEPSRHRVGRHIARHPRVQQV